MTTLLREDGSDFHREDGTDLTREGAGSSLPLFDPALFDPVLFDTGSSVVVTPDDFTVALAQPGRAWRFVAELDHAYEGTPAPGINVCLASNGGTASASSEQTSTPGYRPASAAIDGDRKGAFNNLVWSPLDTYATTPSPWLQVDFPSNTIKRIVLWFGQDSGIASTGQVLAWEQEPNRCTRGADRLPTDFSVDAWISGAWVTITETVTTGNVYVMREYELDEGITTTKLRLNITAGQGVRPLVAEFEAWTEDPVIGTSYFSDGPIIADAPDGKPFRCVIAQLPTISRSIDRSTLTGPVTTSIGTMRFNNTDGRLNPLRSAVVDGLQCRVTMGLEDWDYADFHTVCVARMKRIKQVTDGKGRWLDVIFDDGAFLSDVAIAGAPIPTNPTIRAPIGLGHVICNAVVKDQSTNHWRFCDSAFWNAPLKESSAIQEIWDGAVSLNSAVIYGGGLAPTVATTYDFTTATTIPATSFGYVASSVPAGPITLPGGYGYLAYGSTIIIQVLTPSTGATPTLTINGSTVAADLTTSMPASAGKHYVYRYVTTGVFVSIGIAWSTPTTYGYTVTTVQVASPAGYDVVPTASTGTSATASAPTATPSVAGTLLMALYAAFTTAGGGALATGSGGMTEITEGSGDDGAANFFSMSVNTQALAGTSATGARTSAITNGNGSWIGVSLVLKPTVTATVDTVLDAFTFAGGVTQPIVNDDVVAVYCSTGDTIPGGLTDSNTANTNGRYTQYWAVNASAGQFSLATTRGGSAINLTSAGSGTLTFVARKYWDMGDGSAKLNSTPTGQPQVEFINTPVGTNGYYASDCSAYVQRLLLGTDLTAHASYPLATDDADTLDPPVGIYIGEAMSGAQVMTRIARNANAGWGRMLDGTPYIFRIRTNPLDLSVDPDDFNTAVMTLTDSDIPAKATVNEERGDPLFSTASCYVAMNHPPLGTPRSGAVQAVADTLRAKGKIKSLPIPADGDYATTPERYHDGMTSTGDLETDLTDDSTYYLPFLNYYVTHKRPHLDYRNFPAALRAFVLEIGDKVGTLQPLMAGDTTTLYWQVIGSTIRLQDRQVDLTLVRHRDPDATTASI
jgi:hypothetical protein